MAAVDEHPLAGCFADPCGTADQMFGKLKRLNPRTPDRPAKQNSGDALNIPRRRQIAAEGVDALINSDLIGPAINELSNATIGSGRRLKPQFNQKRLGWTDESYSEVVTETMCLWREHAESKRKYFDQAGDQTLAEMQRSVLEQVIATGECYTLAFQFQDESRPFRTALAVIDNDRIRTPVQGISDEQRKATIAGHLKGPSGRTNAYYVHDYHRNDPRNIDDDYTLVRRTNEFGREQVIHTYLKKLPGMTRGLSHLASSFEDLKCFEKYKKVRMEAAIMQTAMAMVIKSNDSKILQQIGGAPMMNDDQLKKLYAFSLKKAADSQSYYNDNGMHIDGVKAIRLLENESAELLAPNSNSINDGQFVKDCLTSVARTVGMSPATLTQNFEASYSAARATLISFYRQCEMLGTYIVDDWLKSVYAVWLEDVIQLGLLRIPNYPDPMEAWAHFVLNREWYCSAKFCGPARDEIDQAKAIAYWRERQNLGTFSFEDFYDSRGQDAREEIRNQFEMMKYIDRLIDTCPLQHIDPIKFMFGKLDMVEVEPRAPTNGDTTDDE